MRFELMTPGLRDQCSTTELKRLILDDESPYDRELQLFFEKQKKNCLQRGLNSRPLVYKTSALPLSYRGLLSPLLHHMQRKLNWQITPVCTDHM